MGGNEREYGDLVVLMERPPIPSPPLAKPAQTYKKAVRKGGILFFRAEIISKGHRSRSCHRKGVSLTKKAINCLQHGIPVIHLSTVSQFCTQCLCVGNNTVECKKK